MEHLNLFPLEESSLKKGNEEYLQEKKDEKVLLPLFMSLVCFPVSEACQTLLLLSTTMCDMLGPLPLIGFFISRELQGGLISAHEMN